MNDLKTTWLGIELENPLIAASSSLTNSVEGVKAMADAGAGAVVLKSLFEEQIEKETRELEEQIEPMWHAEAYDYVHNMGLELGSREYLGLIEASKQAVSIPVIASLNCVSATGWSDYARDLERAGADALEMNIAYLPGSPAMSGTEVEKRYFDIIRGVKSRVKIPVAVKIGPFFSSLPNFARELVKNGADGLVLFNRFFHVDIDIENLALVQGSPFSSKEEMGVPLRNISMLSGQTECDIAASTGVHAGEGVIKLILAGADAVEVCSALYQQGTGAIGEMLGDLSSWMKKNEFESIGEFRGRLNFSSSENHELWERLQYIETIKGQK